MNDRRFRELVNLHLDLRLSENEAKELEQALRADPARRRLLASYAVMQQGCSVLCRRSAAGAPAPQAILRAIRDAERKAGAPTRPAARAWAWSIWSAAAGMAAVATFLIVRVERPAGFAANDIEPPAPSVMIAVAATNGPDFKESSAPAADSAPPAATNSFLPPHLTLAALGISNETPEVGVVSNWSQPLNDITQAELDRAASWARAVNRSEWAVDATATTRFGAGWSSAPDTQASTVSFTFER